MLAKASCRENRKWRTASDSTRERENLQGAVHSCNRANPSRGKCCAFTSLDENEGNRVCVPRFPLPLSIHVQHTMKRVAETRES